MILAAIATFVGSTLQSATGFGVALVLGPALFAVFTPNEALTSLFLLSATLNVLMLFSERRSREIRGRELSLLLGWAIPGLIAGALVLVALSKPTLQIAVGMGGLAGVVVQVRAREASRGNDAPAWAPPAAGFSSGALSTTTGTSGPPLVLLFQHLDFSPAELRDSLAAAFLALNVFGIAALAAFGGGVANPGTPELAVMLALAVVGQVVGRRLFERLDPRRFRIAGLVLVAGAGLASVVAGVAAS